MSKETAYICTMTFWWIFKILSKPNVCRIILLCIHQGNELDDSSSITFPAYLLGEGLLRCRSPGSGERGEGLGVEPGPGLWPRAEPPGELQITGWSGDWARLSSNVAGAPVGPSCRKPSLALTSCCTGVAGCWASLWPDMEVEEEA